MKESVHIRKSVAGMLSPICAACVHVRNGPKAVPVSGNPIVSNAVQSMPTYAPLVMTIPLGDLDTAPEASHVRPLSVPVRP